MFMVANQAGAPAQFQPAREVIARFMLGYVFKIT
jgi:hypothetical protein